MCSRHRPAEGADSAAAAVHCEANGCINEAGGMAIVVLDGDGAGTAVALCAKDLGVVRAFLRRGTTQQVRPQPSGRLEAQRA